MEEVWKTIPDLRCYEASDLGHIRRIGATKPLKGSCNKEGYVQVRLSENNIQFAKKVHRLVALAFLENPNKLPDVDALIKGSTSDEYIEKKIKDVLGE